MTMIEDDVVEEVLHQCGFAAAGVYLYLERRADKKGQCRPSIATIAEAGGSTERYVTQLINEKLVPSGFVQRKEVKNRFGRTQGVEYTLPYHKKPHDHGGEQTPEHMGEQTPERVGEPLWRSGSPKVDTEVVTSRYEVKTSSSKSKTPVMSPELSEAFESFWQVWPKKEARKDALKAWADVVTDPSQVPSLMAQFRAECREKDWEQKARTDERRYIPLPATWLRRENWVGVVPPKAPSEMTERERLQAEYDLLNSGGGTLYGTDRLRRLSELHKQLQESA